jgi:hypothetical protein
VSILCPSQTVQCIIGLKRQGKFIFFLLSQATFRLFESFEVWGKYLMPFSVHIRVKTTRGSYFNAPFMWLLLDFLSSLRFGVSISCPSLYILGLKRQGKVIFILPSCGYF